MTYFCDGLDRLIGVRRWADFTIATGGVLSTSNVGSIFESTEGRLGNSGVRIIDGNGLTVSETISASFTNISSTLSEADIQCQIAFKVERNASSSQILTGAQPLIAFPGAIAVTPFASTSDTGSSTTSSRFRLSRSQWSSASSTFTLGSALEGNLYLDLWYVMIVRISVTAGASCQYEIAVYEDGNDTPIITDSATLGSSDFFNPFLCRIGCYENMTVDDWVVRTSTDCDAFAALDPPVYVETLGATANGATNQWTSLNGNDNYTNIDEVGAALDSDAVTTAVSGRTDIYQHSGTSSLILTGSTIDAVSIHSMAFSGSGLTLDIAARITSTTTVGSAATLTTQTGPVSRSSTTNVNTAGAWTKSTVDSLQFGVTLP